MRNPNIPFPESAAVWKKGTLVVPYSQPLDPGVNSVRVLLDNGPIQVTRGVANGSETPYSVNAELRIKAWTKGGALRKLHYQQDKIAIRSSAGALDITQIPEPKNVTSPWKKIKSKASTFLTSIARTDPIPDDIAPDEQPVEKRRKHPELAVSLSVPQTAILYMVGTSHGDVHATGVHAQDHSFFLSQAGNSTVVESTGDNISVTADHGDSRVTGHTGKVNLYAIVGKVFASFITGDVEATAPVGDMHFDTITGDVHGMTETGNITSQHVIGSANFDVQTGNTQATDHTGDVRVDIKDGNFQGDELRGDLHVQIGTGNTELHQSTGTHKMKVSHGNVAADGVTGTVDITVYEGDVSLSGSEFLGLVNNVSTDDGTLRLGSTNEELVVHAGTSRLAENTIHLSGFEPDPDFLASPNTVVVYKGSDTAHNLVRLDTQIGDIFIAAEDAA